MTLQPPSRGCVFVPSIQPGCTLPDDPTSVRFIVEGGDHIGWFVIDLEDGGRVMDDACGTRAEAEEAAREYANPS